MKIHVYDGITCEYCGLFDEEEIKSKYDWKLAPLANGQTREDYILVYPKQ